MRFKLVSSCFLALSFLACGTQKEQTSSHLPPSSLLNVQSRTETLEASGAITGYLTKLRARQLAQQFARRPLPESYDDSTDEYNSEVRSASDFTEEASAKGIMYSLRPNVQSIGLRRNVHEIQFVGINSFGLGGICPTGIGNPPRPTYPVSVFLYLIRDRNLAVSLVTYTDVPHEAGIPKYQEFETLAEFLDESSESL